VPDRSWSLGVRTLTFDGQFVTFAGADQEREPVVSFLERGTAPYNGVEPERLRAALAEIRSLLDGWFELGGARIRFERGLPRELAGDAYCGDVARGGHSCGPDCAGDVDYAHSLPRASALVGRPLVAGPWRWRDHPHAPYVAEVYAELSSAT
jgi:hypothetical protein